MRTRITPILVLLLLIGPVSAQTPPEIGYVFPPGGPPGSTMDVRIGGYNWTPDMQLFVHDPHVKLELTGPPSEVLVPEPPYWFGKKARDNDFPLPREFPARLTIAADASPGLVRWQAANANGATGTGTILISGSGVVFGGSDVHLERSTPKTTPDPFAVPKLPAAVVGQIQKLEEVDRVSFTAEQSGVVTLDLWTRRLGSQMNAILEVRNEAGQLVADGADTAGHDLQLTVPVRAAERYTISLYDTDFRGHRSFVYRLVIQDGPQIVAAIPAAGKRGEIRTVEFVGIGLATGKPVLESVSCEVTFPTDPAAKAFAYQLATPFGKSLPYKLRLGDWSEFTEASMSADKPLSTFPVAVTGVLDVARGDDRFAFTGKKGDSLSFTCRSAKAGMPLDIALAILNSDGKELARVDDLPGSSDSGLLFTVPDDGIYNVSVSDQSGQSGSRSAVYSLTAESLSDDLTLTIPDKLNLPLGGTAKLPVKIVRQGRAAPIALELSGLPSGVTAPPSLSIPADKSELTVELTCTTDCAATAELIGVRASTKFGERDVSRESESSLLAVTMKPRAKITPEGLDDVRKWPRGSTYLAPVLIERLEGFTGEVLLEQTAHQQRVRQGITGPDMVVPSGVNRVEYPVFLPEWLETTKTSRIILNGVTKVSDPRGNERYLLNKMEMRIGMLPVGALLKIAHATDELHISANQPFEIPIHLTRSNELSEPARVELVVPLDVANRYSAEPVVAPPTESKVILRVHPAEQSYPTGEIPLTIRATVLRNGKWPVISETTCVVEFSP
jgi:hypothetical protein